MQGFCTHVAQLNTASASAFADFRVSAVSDDFNVPKPFRLEHCLKIKRNERFVFQDQDSPRGVVAHRFQPSWLSDSTSMLSSGRRCNALGFLWGHHRREEALKASRLRFTACGCHPNRMSWVASLREDDWRSKLVTTYGLAAIRLFDKAALYRRL